MPAEPPSAVCACQAPKGSETSPEMALGSGGFVLLSARENPDDYCTETRLVCRLCGRRYLVVDDRGYWKPLYRWSALDP